MLRNAKTHGLHLPAACSSLPFMGNVSFKGGVAETPRQHAKANSASFGQDEKIHALSDRCHIS